MTPFTLPARYVYTGTSFRGGQGNVWICEDHNLDRKVAVKVMNKAQSREQFIKEVSSIRAIFSKHIAQIYDLCSHKKTGRLALIQEFIPGPDLAERAMTGVPLTDAIRILYQVASGLADIHRAGIIHRDLKAENIKIDNEGIVKIFDFGLSCDARDETETVAARGTHVYRSPEMYRPGLIPISPPIDVYAFGILCWVLISQNRLPAALHSIPPQEAGPPPSIATVAPDLTRDLAEVIDAALNVTPEARPTALALQTTLANRLMFGRHRAVVAKETGGDPFILSSPDRAVLLTFGALHLEVVYDGLQFKVRSASDLVRVNNVACNQGDVLPGSCVIALGTGRTREFFLFDVSHPEVVL